MEHEHICTLCALSYGCVDELGNGCVERHIRTCDDCVTAEVMSQGNEGVQEELPF